MNRDLARSNASALHYLLPSVRDIVFICLFWSLLSGPLSSRLLADLDIGWHIRNGEIMLATHRVPRTDPFSSTMQGQPWYAWEWLYDLILGVLHKAGGLNAVVWLAACLISAILTLLLSQLLKRGTGLPLALLLMVLAEAAASIHMFARPHIVSWLFVLLWFIALERWEQGKAPRWIPWFFPVSMVLWVNLHGAWLLGIALLSFYTLAVSVQGARASDSIERIVKQHRAGKMLLTLGVSLLTTLINPYGWNLHIHVYRYLSDRYLIDRIVEFRSPDFHGWAQRSFALIVLLVLLAFFGSRRKPRLIEVLIALFAVYAGLFATRNLPVSSILLVLVAGPILWEDIGAIAERPTAWNSLRTLVIRLKMFSVRAGEQELKLRGHLWAALTVILALVLCLRGGRLGSRQLVNAQFDPEHVPVAASSYLDRQPDREPVFSVDQWGGYLIYRFYPRRQVVIDDRHDLFGADRFREYLTLVQLEPGWREVLEKWGIRTMVLPAGSALANLLLELPREWEVVHEDKVAVVFQKSGGASAGLSKSTGDAYLPAWKASFQDCRPLLRHDLIQLSATCNRDGHLIYGTRFLEPAPSFQLEKIKMRMNALRCEETCR